MIKQLKLLSLILMIWLCLLTNSIAENQFEQIFEFFTSLTSNNTALAFWIEDTSGTYKHTVCVTYKVSKIGMGVQRPSILPVWGHRRDDEWGTGYPTSENPLPDAVTTATPSVGDFIWDWDVPSSLEPGDYYYFVEVNIPWDPNEYYTDSTRGQPSVVFRGSLKVDTESTNTTGVVVGHGHETGATGYLASTIDSLTTALDLITSVKADHYLAPSITTSTLPDAYANSLYNAEVSIQDLNSSDSHTFQLLEKPNWMIITYTGVISGTPDNDDVGKDIRLVIKVEDTKSLSDTLTTMINVLDVLDPPMNLFIEDVPKDNGHQCQLKWDKSPDDDFGLVSWYYIYRSRLEELTEPVPLAQFDHIDSLRVWEKYYTILIDSVRTGITEYLDVTVPVNSEPYYYWLQAVGESGESEKVAFGIETTVKTIPNEFNVSYPYPNPFNPSTTIQYEIPENSHVKLVIYDTLGRKVSVLTDTLVSAGTHETVWDGRNYRGETVGSGVYIFQLIAGANKTHGKILFLR